MAIHDFEAAAIYPNYSASKSAGTILVQQIAKGVSPDDMQVLSFHPGAIFTAAAKKAGYTTETLPWDDEDLPGHYVVWAASDEAKFLHGRFTWAAWDVDEIANGEVRERIAADANYLKVGVDWHLGALLRLKLRINRHQLTNGTLLKDKMALHLSAAHN
ncbi:hypothetical protein PWT90_09052 [Aphanocladium album]|nr:hypothetical protein PWT90_09052 [Aphanocladium album]